jgi:2-keto-4-pentenoate hydratase/2-oxohepta-3-ene-1,7-dioic acid hydratase in catechol pathway
MRYCRFRFENEILYGLVEDRGGEPWIVDLANAPEEDLAFHLERARGSGKKKVVTDLAAFDFDPVPLNGVELLAPVTPSKIVCVGRNYRDHAKELGNEVPAEPLLFFKPPSSLLGHRGMVIMPPQAERVDFEGEMALVIGKKASKLAASDDWRNYVRGYTIANDVTARDLQKKDGQWARAKGFDTFCPVGPVVSSDLDPEKGLTVETRVNGELKQHGSTIDFIFSIPVLLSYITAAITLEAGDLLLTGTPAGVGPLAPGDTVEISITGLGALSNTFSAAPKRP